MRPRLHQAGHLPHSKCSKSGAGAATTKKAETFHAPAAAPGGAPVAFEMF
jgi:hypothetical protein